MATPITRDGLQAAIEAGDVAVVETLRAEHFEQGHLPGAIHIHFEDIGEKAPALLPDRDAAIVTYCSNTACGNSESAANQRWATRTCASTPKASRTGSRPAYPSKPEPLLPDQPSSSEGCGRVSSVLVSAHRAVAAPMGVPASGSLGSRGDGGFERSLQQ